MMEGKFILFSTMAFFGIGLWILWNFLILSDPLYFTNSPFSAKSQQQNWLARGELPAYGNILMSFAYYTVTSYASSGISIFLISVAGFFWFLVKGFSKNKLFLSLLFLVPFIFYVATLYLGQSVIFIPQLTPPSF